jgi:hypothetical protein
MKLVSFDLEIAKILPEETFDWQAERPLGISCAALRTRGYGPMMDKTGITYKAHPQLSTDEAGKIVDDLYFFAKRGHTLVTVNGTGFDLQILAEESGRWLDCANLAINYHCDLMLMSVCAKGWRTGPDTFAQAANSAKMHNVTLKDGSVLDDMHGGRAPQMWVDGEDEAVLAYLRQDVDATLDVALVALMKGELVWYAKSGNPHAIPLQNGRLPTVAEMLEWPYPNVGWMDNPPSRLAIVGWALDILKEDA